MGLELVELVMSIEQEFGFRVGDAEAASFVTVGELSNHVLATLRARGPTHPSADTCHSHRAFNELRAAFVREGCPRRIVRPDSTVIDVLRGTPAERTWGRVARAMALPRPRFDVLRPFASLLPAPETRIRDLVRHRIARGPYRYVDRGGTIDATAVLARVMRIVAEITGVEASTLRPDTRFIDDLHMG